MPHPKSGNKHRPRVWVLEWVNDEFEVSASPRPLKPFDDLYWYWREEAEEACVRKNKKMKESDE